jgi:hypothetical protein
MAYNLPLIREFQSLKGIAQPPYKFALNTFNPNSFAASAGT